MDENLPLILKHCFKNVKKLDRDNVSASCITCAKTLKGSLVATTNFLNHLKTKEHADMLKEYEELKASRTIIKRKSNDRDSITYHKKMKQTTLSEAGVAISFDNLIVDFVVETMIPLSIVEYKSFGKLIEGANKLLKTPKILGRRSLIRKIDEKYHHVISKIKQSLQTVDFVCTTADVWSSSKRSYLGMTIHWIDTDTLERGGAAIACRRFKGAHTYDKVAKMISEVHSEFDLKLCKITKTVTDNGSNMVKAFKMFGSFEFITSSLNCQQSNDCNTISYDNENNVDENNEEESNEEDEVNGDNDLISQTFPEPVKDYVGDYELPSHERCATHTLHLIAAVDIKEAIAESNAYKKIHYSVFGKCQALWNLCVKSPKACKTYLDTTGNLLHLHAQQGGILITTQ